MLNSILDRRVRKDNGYDLYLEIPENEYFNVYEDVTENNARNIVDLFLEHYQDDGRPQMVKVNYDKGNNSINIKTVLSYVGNDFTEHPDNLR